MRLVDRLSQCHAPLIVHDTRTGACTRLSSACDSAREVSRCAVRYLLADELVHCCAALAYSRGARALACADLIHVPFESVWVEWCEAPWVEALRSCGFARVAAPVVGARRGALFTASADGRRGAFRTFWSTGESCPEVCASAMQARFDLDAPGAGEDTRPVSPGKVRPLRVVDPEVLAADVLARCFSFEFEPSWASYYERARLEPAALAAIERHSLGTIALDLPLLLAFFLLLGTRSGLPQHSVRLDRLNRARARAEKPPLLDHIEVSAPLLPGDAGAARQRPPADRRSPRRHPVRGHLVRRGDQLHWRIPHFRGTLLAGLVRTRTVTWTFERGAAAH
jgi:hypothetical protein